MTLTIELSPEPEAQLQEEAARKGIDASTFATRTLEAQLRRKTRGHRVPSQPDREELTLLQQINQGFPEEFWHEYERLITRRRAETLTTDEHARLITLSDRIEEAHSKRMGYLVELAGRRQVPVETLMGQLGVGPRAVL